MRSRYSVRARELPHFVTSTIVDWLPVFATPACCDLLAESLAFGREHKALRLYAWVIMENHFHAVVQADELPRVMADWKKFTAQRLLALIEREGRNWLLELLARAKAAHKRRSRFQLWLAFEERYGGSL